MDITSRWTGGPYYLTPEQRKWTQELFERALKQRKKEKAMTGIRAIYRKHSTHKCKGCDHPAWSPSKRVNAKRRCVKCRKDSTQRVKDDKIK